VSAGATAWAAATQESIEVIIALLQRKHDLSMPTLPYSTLTFYSIAAGFRWQESRRCFLQEFLPVSARRARATILHHSHDHPLLLHWFSCFNLQALPQREEAFR
jgi:hypothetical protein